MLMTRSLPELAEAISDCPDLDSMVRPPEEIERILIELGVDWSELDYAAKKGISMFALTSFFEGKDWLSSEISVDELLETEVSEDIANKVAVVLRVFMVAWYLGRMYKEPIERFPKV